ncbi:MAG: hypothetical protein QXH10_06755 [Ignisphaera sp.]|uniref:Uncharacterized protein n=1 Tax=Ignisphaera aggregans TaxID=334771 RepID=A0A7C4NMM3_9CREN
MTVKVKISKTIGDYVAMEVPAEEAVNIINILQDGLGRGGEDTRDAIRMIEHFETFYDMMRRKFKEYLTPRKDIGDILKKRVLIDKIKLLKRDGNRFVEIIFDKSIGVEEVLNILKNNSIEVKEG